MPNSNDIQTNKAVLKHSHVISVCIRMFSGEQVSQRLRHLWIFIICLWMEECAYPIGIPLASYPQLMATLPPSAPPGASQDGSPTSGTPSLLLEGECAAYRVLLQISPSDYKAAKPLGEKAQKDIHLS